MSESFKDNRERDNYILPEGNVDALLMEILIPPKKRYNQQGGAPAVTTKMKGQLADCFAVGILDKDQRKVHYKNEFDVLVEKHGVTLYRHKIASKHHYFICHPKFEKWILAEAKQLGLSLEHYNLPQEFNELKKITQPESCKNDPRLKKLFKDLKNKEANGITTLLKWTDYLISNTYKADKTTLINIGNAP
ncbi:hypothetical protein [Methylocucumis oryzae]|uniref:Uncharacterized protein n=1 Tax=Methylocucumis oryzae TaxID=1632867 RepID=A0A0F3IJD4_9GAMM|nr:hypothetical protein [Methylocucumis oryzae]KJV06628.1 hypothetical protein VZ94_10050 [Methylocucumis oryzae]